jgi:hypothetical protein
MSCEHNKPGELNENEGISSRLHWLCLAFSPAALILLMIANLNSNPANPQVAFVVAFGVNPLLSIIGAGRLLTKNVNGKPVRSFWTLPLGLAIAVLNLFIGICVGCGCAARGLH